MKKSILYITLFVASVIVVGLIGYYRNQEPDYAQLGHKYLKVDEKTYLLQSIDSLKIIGKNFKDVGKLDNTYETNLNHNDNYHIYIDNNQKEIIYVGYKDEYLCMLEGSYYLEEKWALPPTIQVNDRIYYCRMLIESDLLPSQYQYAGVIENYYNKQTQKNFSTTDYSVLGKKVYTNNDNYIYVQLDDVYVRWDAQNN